MFDPRRNNQPRRNIITHEEPEISNKDKERARKDADRDYYSQQQKEDAFYEEMRLKEAAEKKRRAKEEMLASHEQQLREKAQKKALEKEKDTYYSKTSQEISSFANQDRIREEHFQKLKGNTARPNENQYVEVDSKKAKEREIFLENQRAAAQKKAENENKKYEQQAQDRYKVMSEYAQFQEQQEYNKYQKSKQQEETIQSLQDQIREKTERTPSKQPLYESSNRPYTGSYETDAQSDYAKIKAQARGSGYNIISHN